MQRLWVRWIVLQVSFSSGPFSPQLCSALWFFQRSFAFFSDNGVFCLTRILDPQGLLPGEPSKPIQSRWLGTRTLHIWNCWFPSLITKSLFHWQLIRPSRCEPQERLPPGVVGPFSLPMFSLSNVLSQEKSPASGSALWKAFGWFRNLRITCEFTRSQSSVNEWCFNLRHLYFCYFTNNYQKFQVW